MCLATALAQTVFPNSYLTSHLSPCLQIQKILATIKSDVASGDCTYTRFLAIGLFRLLELTDARDPKALEGLVTVCLPAASLLSPLESCLASSTLAESAHLCSVSACVR